MKYQLRRMVLVNAGTNMRVPSGRITARLERVILPSHVWLQQAADTARGRQLFDSQVVPFGRVLDESVHLEVITLWQLMKRLRSAVTQERMFLADDSRGFVESVISV